MHSAEILVTNSVGLHARPAAMFVKLANRFSASITLKNLTTDSEWINAKSMLSLLTAGVSQGHRIAIRAEGQDETKAVEALIELIRSDFAQEITA
ncbi:MAG: HPr family phosphocarrier protein [Anaerolineales bacterium]|nr:HPr family phosphocarrier protein [Anaerolineales bacterium]MDW8445855.1 HPr family phosphocarrier protein [Anaerolineales bacterium]